MINLEHMCMGCMGDNKGEEVCSICGFDSNSVSPAYALNLKTVLKQRYIVGKIINDGVDGITYLGYDALEEKTVRIKEYYPSNICARKDGLSVRVKKDSTYTYNSGIMDFLELSRKLQDVGELSGIYKVLDVFEENGTAYRITEYSNGINLREFLLRNGGLLTWGQAKPLFLPMFNTLTVLHKNGIIHRGISPETLIIGRDGKLRLIEFSIKSARTSYDEMPAQLFAGFAAIEQYEKGDEDQTGTYTDVYGLAATLFRTLIGNPPPEATQRVISDNMSFPRKYAESIPKSVLIALANALQISKEDRTETIAAFKEDITAEVYDEEEKPKPEDKKRKQNDKNTALKAAIITFAAVLLVIIILLFTVFRPAIFGNNRSTSSFAGLESMESVGNVSNTVSFAEKLYTVPDFSGKTFAEASSDITYSAYFTYSISSKQYSSTVEKGKIISQSVAKDTNAPKDTEISFVISLGPKEFKLPTSLKGKNKTDAYIKMLEMGIEPSSIDFIEKFGDTATKESVVLETTPALGSTITTDTKITVFINTNLISNQSLEEE